MQLPFSFSFFLRWISPFPSISSPPSRPCFLLSSPPSCQPPLLLLPKSRQASPPMPHLHLQKNRGASTKLPPHSPWCPVPPSSPRIGAPCRRPLAVVDSCFPTSSDPAAKSRSTAPLPGIFCRPRIESPPTGAAPPRSSVPAKARHRRQLLLAPDPRGGGRKPAVAPSRG